MIKVEKPAHVAGFFVSIDLCFLIGIKEAHSKNNRNFSDHPLEALVSPLVTSNTLEALKHQSDVAPEYPSVSLNSHHLSVVRVVRLEWSMKYC